MKKILLFAIAITFLGSCNVKEEVKPHFTLKGEITGLENKSVYLKSKSSIDTITLDSLGRFSIEKELVETDFYSFRAGRTIVSLYLKDGYNLSFETTKQDIGKDIVFAGKGSLENNTLFRKNQIENAAKGSRPLFSNDPDVYTNKVDSISNNLAVLTKEYDDTPAGHDQEFSKILSLDNKFLSLFLYSIYPKYNSYLTGNENVLSDSISKLVTDNIIDNDEFLVSKNYLEFISMSFNQEFTALQKEDQDEEEGYINYLKWLGSELNHQKVKNELLYKGTSNVITYLSEKGRDEMYDVYTKLNTDLIYQERIDITYKSYETLRKGMAASKWSYPDIDGKEHSLDSFKGKLVYIDVWATWCGPCKAEIPALQQLVKDYQGKDIVFVSISVDDNKNAWEKMIKENNYDWYQIHAEKAWNSTIVKDNLIKGIPRFMMVDREGNIISVNAPRPTTDDVRVLIDEELK